MTQGHLVLHIARLKCLLRIMDKVGIHVGVIDAVIHDIFQLMLGLRDLVLVEIRRGDLLGGILHGWRMVEVLVRRDLRFLVRHVETEEK